MSSCENSASYYCSNYILFFVNLHILSPSFSLWLPFKCGQKTGKTNKEEDEGWKKEGEGYFPVDFVEGFSEC